MATRVKPAPADKLLYEDDFYVWTERQASLLRAGRFEALDLDNLTLEVEGLGDAKRSAVLNNARTVIEHLLTLQHSPTVDPRKARAIVFEHRSRLEIELTPRLQQVLAEELPRMYHLAHRSAVTAMHDHGEDTAADALPETCPYNLDRIAGDWLP